MTASIKRLFSSWSFWAISFSIFLRYCAYAAIQVLWAGPFLIQYLRLSHVTAGNLLLIISIGFIIGSPTGGAIKQVSGDLAGPGEAYATAFLICSAAVLGSAALYFTTQDSRIFPNPRLGKGKHGK